MYAYTVINQFNENSGVYHSTENGAIIWFMMNGNKGAYLGNVLNDFENFKKQGARVQEFKLVKVE